MVNDAHMIWRFFLGSAISVIFFSNDTPREQAMFNIWSCDGAASTHLGVSDICLFLFLFC